MSALTSPVLINQNRAYWLSSIQNDVTHSTITCREIDADLARFSTVYVSDELTTSTLRASTFTLNYLDLSEANISTVKTNSIFTSSQTWASDLSGGVGYVRISTDASGVQVDGDPIRFDNLVYFTSTITIVPVSTLIDTDIFSQNGYFSTLSSGSISSGALQTSSLLAQNAFMSTLTVSSITTTDISGFSPTTWSLYPTLNSSITFNAGTQNILSNVGAKLYFAGNELTDMSGGGQDWSNFPATTDVSMNNFSIRQLSTLQYQDGARLYSQTGNNLFYNGQPVYYGPAGNASNWSQFPAKTNITAGQSTLTVGNIQNNGSNITNGNTFTNSLGVGGLSLVPIASISAGGDLSCRNIEVGDIGTSLADVNIYGNLAGPGDSALYVAGGVQFDGGTIHGFAAGLLPVAGVNTGRMELLTAGFNILHPAVGAITTGAAMGITAGGALSLAGGGYVEVNTSTIQCINTTQGNKNTTLQTGFLTIDPDLGATSSIKLFNVLGGGVEIDGGGQGSLQGFSTVKANNISSVSSVANTVLTNFAQISSIFYGQALGVSTTIGALRVNNIQIADNITGVTNAPNPNQSRLLNFSTLNSFNVSTTDLWVSSINGQPIDISGSPFVNTNMFSTLFTSSFYVSTLQGPTYPGATPVSTVIVDGGFVFRGDYQGNANSSRFLSSLRNINSAGENLTIEGGGAAGKEFFLQVPGSTPDPWKYIRLGDGSAFDTKIRAYGNGSNISGAVSTGYLLAKSIIADPSVGIDVSGALNMVGGDINVPDLHAVGWTSGEGYTRLERRDIATANMLSVTSFAGLASNNMAPLAVGELWLTGGADQYQAVRIYSQFPYGNYEFDVIDADGATLFAYMQGYENPFGTNPGFLQAYSNVSSISGYDESSAPNQMLHVINGLTTSNLIVSSINGAVYPPGGAGISSFQTLFTSSFQFSTATSAGSNTDFNYPIFIDYDQAGNTTTAGVAIAVQGHNFGSGAVVNRIEMGARATGENYIMSVWPGQNLEELYIDATDLTVRDGIYSTIINLDPWGLQTSGGILGPFVSTLALNVSSINATDANKAYTNNLQLSTMTLYTASTTLAYWDSTTVRSNVNTSGYDTVVGINGTYKIGCSHQATNVGGTDDMSFFFLKNDVAIPNSATYTLVKNNELIATYAEIIEPLNNGDKIQVGYYTSGSNVIVSTIGGATPAGDAPAAILTVYKID